MRRPAVALLLALAASLLAPVVRADGAFPDGQQLFLPEESDEQVVFGTNFGLLTGSAKEGFRLVCEVAISQRDLVRFFARSRSGRLHAAYASTVASSTDLGCTWRAAPAFPALSIRDLWADPSDRDRLWALGTGLPTSEPSRIHRSDDGTGWGPSILEVADGELVGVENALSEPGRLYASARIRGADGGLFPALLEQQDGGWLRHDHPEIPGEQLGLASVDRTDPDTLWLRRGVLVARDALAVSHDRGVTVTTELQLEEPMSAFVQASDGTLYVATRSGLLWVKEPGQQAFRRTVAPRIRCLAERRGVLWACADNFEDGFAVGLSRDHGRSWEPVMRFQEVKGLATCAPIQDGCQAAWTAFAETFGIGRVVPDAGTGTSEPEGPTCQCSSVDGGALVVLLLGFALRGRGTRAGRPSPRR